MNENYPSLHKISPPTVIDNISGSGPKDRSITGKDIARLRKRFAMTQGQFARLLGVSPPSVGKWEKRKGRLNLHARTLNKKEARARLDDGR